MAAAGEDPEMYALIGTAYYQMEQNSKIIEPVEKAASCFKAMLCSPT